MEHQDKDPLGSNGRPILFGEVLFDTFPDGNRVLGGAPFNCAWHLQAFGAEPLFVSSVGEDDAGVEVRHAMEKWAMDTSGLQTDPEHATGQVSVTYKEGQPSFDIVVDQAYDNIDAGALPSVKGSLLYHGSLALRQSVSSQALDALKSKDMPIYVDINLRDPWWQPERALELLCDARWVKINDEELSRLTGAVASKESAQRFFEEIGLEWLVLTLGSKGALGVTGDGVFAVEPAAGIKAADPVGAGDAFASITLLGLLNGWDAKMTMERAQAFASEVVQHQGAVVENPEIYLEFSRRWGIT